MSHKKHKNSEWFIHVLRIVRRVLFERTRNPYASAYEVLRTDDDQQWSYMGSLTDILGNGRYSWMYLEGPGLFRYNDADVKTINGRKMRFGLMCDQYAEAAFKL